MNVRNLEYLLALLEEGHFGRAAARCGVTQPTLSMQIAQLEAELGTQLFERRPRKVIPTPQGQAVATQAAVVLNEINRLREIARMRRDLLAGPFRLGLIPTVGPYLLPRLLPILTDNRPTLRLMLREGLTAALVERVRAADLDAAILSLPVEERDIESEPILVEPFVLALPPGHRLEHRDPIEVEDLAGESLLFLEEGHCMRDQTSAICRRIRRRKGELSPAASVESLRQMVHVGMGCALFPHGATLEPFARTVPVVFRSLGPHPPARTLALAWRRGSPSGTQLRALAVEIRQKLEATPPPA